MTMYNQPYLEKYSGRQSRHKCPKCGDQHSFAYYLDGDTGEPIDEAVGRCNHESSCGYHYTPKQFFIDNPTLVNQRKDSILHTSSTKPFIHQHQLTDYIPFKYVEQSASYKSAFVSFLCKLFDLCSLDSPTIDRLMNDYALGATKDGGVIFWQIDIHGKVRTGKVMRYDAESGHRIKDFNGINWIHSIMKSRHLLPEDFHLGQCLFGEHLLKVYPSKVVALVESEKSAIIASAVYPNYVWLATGGKSQLSLDKLKVLKGRAVIMFPDVDGYDLWADKAKAIRALGCKVLVSDVLEKNATPEERKQKIDIADWLIRYLSEQSVQEVKNTLSDSERILQTMITKNQSLQLLIDKFNLSLIA